jgi:hypothetical protein
VAARAVQFPQTMTVTHVNSFDSKFWSSSSIALVEPKGLRVHGPVVKKGKTRILKENPRPCQ